jgi:hypothetical protein
MSKNTNRKGLALGAMFSLVASLFGATPASAAPSTTAFTFSPVEGSSYSTLLDEDFHMTVTRDTAVMSETDFNNYLKYEISTNRAYNSSTYSVGVIAGIKSGLTSTIDNAYGVSASANLTDGSNPGEFGRQRIYQGGNALALAGYLPAFAAGGYSETQSYVVVPTSRSSTVSTFIGLQLLHYGAGLYPTSESGAVTVTVRAFLDLNGDNVYSSTTEPSGTQTVSFVKYSSVTKTVTVPSVNEGATSVEISATVSGINLEQLDGKWSIRANQWGPVGLIGAVSHSATAVDGTTFTFSAPVTLKKTFTLVSTSKSHSVSADLVYFRSGATAFAEGRVENYTSFSTVIRWANAGTMTVPAPAATSFVHYAVAGDNVEAQGWATGAGREYDVRANSRYTIQFSASGVISGSAQTVTFTFSNPAVSATKYYTVNGGSAVTSGTASAVTATIDQVTGLASLTIVTTGFAAGDALSVSAKIAGSAEVEIGLQAEALSYTLTADATDIAITPGGVANVGAVAKDQFGVASSATNQRMKFSWASGYSGTATVSDVVLSAGRASAAMTHGAATSTAAATITVQLQDTTGGSNLWSNVGSAVTINVTPTNATNGFRTGLAKSYSATISYGAAFSWSPVINEAYVIVTGSSVVVSSTGLIFKDDVTGKTASDTITLPGDSNARVKFYVTARKAGTYTLTLTAGTATTTSLIVVSAAQDNAGSAMAFDISSMESGRAAIVTGTLTDVNGNAVDTSLGGATIALSVTGTGATYVGSLNTETNADGKFQVALLSGTGQTGTITITAVYSPTSGAAAADKVTKVHSVTIAAPVTPEVNAVIGSFGGRWAVRVENAKGSVVSVKAGNRWVKFSALNNNYLFSRKSVVGRTIAVSVWVDGELQNSQTITIK